MLALKECLIREGVLNLNTPNNLTSSPNISSTSQTYSSPYPLYRNHYSFGSQLDLMASSALGKKSVIDSSVNDLTSASATAKTSCQLQQQNPQQLQLQHPQSEQQQQSLLKKQQNFKRYQGHHPHFHHHTAPAYYTDLHLRIHTPEVKDSLNENYQSVYRTPSNLVKDERQFPKTATATASVPPPAPLKAKSPKEFTTTTEQKEGDSSTASASFFRGGGCGLPRGDKHQQQQRKSVNDPYGTSSPSLANPAKGNSPQFSATAGQELPPLAANADGSVVFACTNFKPCVSVNSDFVQSPTGPTLVSPKQSPSTGRSSRNTQRFSNRRRAVRVRSESRPISALYDIICKEKGLDICTTTTNDEDSSPHNSHDEKSTKSRRSHSRSVPKQTKASGNNVNVMMSPGGDPNQTRSGSAASQKKRSKDKHSSPSTAIFINDLSDNEDDDGLILPEGGCSRKPHRLKKKAPVLLGGDNLQAKSSSLPPGLKSLSDFSLNAENHNNHHNHEHHHHHHHHPSSKVSQDSFKSLQTSSASDNVLNANYSSLSSTAATNPAAAAATTSPVPAQLQEATASGAGTSSAVMVASPKAERFPRKYRRSRDEKPRRHTDGAVQLLATEQINDQQEQQQSHQYQHDDDHDDEAGEQSALHRHHHRHDRHHHQHHASQQPQHPHLHDLNGAGHDFHVSTNAANAKRFITRSQRATSAGIINGAQPSDSSSSASNSPIPPGRLSPPSIASSSLQQQQQQQQEIPLLSKSPTVTGKTENGFATTVKDDMTNNSGGGGSVKPPTIKSPKTSAAKAAAAAVPETTVAATRKIKKANASDLKSQIPFNDAEEAALPPVPAATPAPVPAASAKTVSETPTIAATPLAVISDKKKGEETNRLHQQQQRFTSPTSPKHQAQRTGPASENNHSNKSPSGSEGEPHKPMPSSSSSTCSPTNRSKKLVPSVSVSVKQNLNEMHCTASRSNSIRSNASSPKSPKHKSSSTTVECTVKVPSSPKSPQKQQSNNSSNNSNNSSNSSSNRHQATVMPPSPPIALVDDIDDDFMEIHDLPMDGPILRPRCSTMQNDTNERRRSSSSSLAPPTNEPQLELSPVHRSRHHDRSPRRPEERDKSSKRKSNLNRSQNEEAIPDSDEAAARRRKRRELGMARALVPSDDAAAVKELLTSPSKTQPTTTSSPPKPAIRNDLSYHMEMARRGLDQTSTANATANRRRAQTASPKHVKETPSPPSNSKAQTMPKVSRRSDTVAIGELRKQRTDEVNRKMNERTRSDLAEIIKIAEIANECSESAASAISDLTKTMNRLRTSQEREESDEANHSSPSGGGKHATFHQEECIYYEPDPLEHSNQNGGDEANERSKLGGILRSQRMLKARSIERESSFEPPKLSPILRRKSTDDPLNTLNQTPNHIVSILKKKDHLSANESSSASSNASPVTFSASVMDTPSKHKRAGILKKRSSLDESRYYSRSHSPDERSIFIKSARRNSLEETAANNMAAAAACSLTQGPQGILKQSSYDSFKSDSCPSAGGGAVGGSGGESQHPHSILKKKDSTSTPSDGAQHATKHVSISQAVILAAAELSATEIGPENNAFNDELSYTPSNEEYDIKPILKLETFSNEEVAKPPKPILKKKSSGDSDEHEIKPILKTSRKSSREEFDFDPFSESENSAAALEPSVRPILKTDSPSKRRSLGSNDTEDPDNEPREANSPYMLKRRTRSLERQDQTPVIDLGAALNAIATSQENTDDLVASLTSSTPGANISVADRIKSMEKFLNNQSVTTPSSTTVNTSWESPLQNDPNKSVEPTAAGGAAGAVKILKPSVIRRDLLKDRYKTQPVTSDEKNFFKSNDSSSTLYTSPAGSAFKPAKSLEGLGFINITAHGNQSPNAPTSAFALTRSFTQPLQSSSSSSFKGSVAATTRKTPNRSSLLQLNDSTGNQSDLTHSFTGDSGLSCDSNSEQRIFEMSGLEHDVDMIENQEPKTPSNADVSTGSSSGSGIVRTNSVRARANMFQQLQEKTNNGGGNGGLNREERTSPKRVPRRLSPSPAPLNATTSGVGAIGGGVGGCPTDEPRTPNNPPANPDEEIASSSSGVAPAFEPPRGILKSKSSVIGGGIGFMPTDLTNELKNRLKCSQNSSLTNLRKSATTSDAVRDLQQQQHPQPSTTSGGLTTTSGLASGQHDDAVNLVRNLTNLGKPPQLRDPMKMEPDIASASEGESSGGREVSEIIKNSAVARRRKFNEGLNIAMKHHPLPPPAAAGEHFWPYKQNPYHLQQQQHQQQHQQPTQHPLQNHNHLPPLQQQQKPTLQAQPQSFYKYQRN